MDKKQFWDIIGQAKLQSGTDMELRYELIKNKLTEYPAEEMAKFSQIASTYIYSAEENLLLWAACKVMEGYASDDTYLYFCCWLVSEGYEVYSAAAKDPETLVSTADYEFHEFEMLMYAPVEAYAQKFGQEPEWDYETSDDERTALLEGIEFADDTPFREDEEAAKSLIPQYLPRLIERFNYDHEGTMEEMRLMREDPEALMALLKQQAIDAGISEEDIDNILKMGMGRES